MTKDVYAVYYLRTNGEMKSEFKELMLPLLVESGRLLEGVLNTSNPIQTAKATFSSVSPGGDYGWHNAKEIMLVLTLSGEIEVEVSGPGPKRRFRAGDVVLVEEKPDGAGHRTKVISETPWKALMIRVDRATVAGLLRNG